MQSGIALVFMAAFPAATPTPEAVAKGAYWFAGLSLAVGVLAGFQAINDRYPQESPSLAVKPVGLTYLGIRGAVPAILFCIALGQEYPVEPWALALGLGVSTELFLRLKVFIKESQQADGTIEQILAGPFDLLKWYQDFFLIKLGVNVGELRRDAIKNLFPDNLEFAPLCNRIEDSLGVVADATTRQKISAAVIEQKAAFLADTTTPASEKDKRYKTRLGFALMSIADKRTIIQVAK